MVTWREYYDTGRERRLALRNPFERAFVRLFGPINIHPRIRAGHVLRTIQTLNLPENAHILDAGSGRGLVLFALAKQQRGFQLHGIELNTALVLESNEIAEKLHLGCLTFESGDLAAMDSMGGPYDLIFSIDVLEHIVEDVRVLHTLYRAVKEDGTLVLHLPLRHQRQWRFFSTFKNHTVPDHVRDEYTPDEVQAKLEKAGFEMKDLRYGFGRQGELAFELNTLFWRNPILRAALALLTFPFAWWLGYRDVNASLVSGNSMIFLAKPIKGKQ